MRKFFTFLFAALLSVSMWALTPLSGDVWDESTGTLTVNSNPGDNAYDSNSEIQHLVFSDAVTSIGEYAFGDCPNLLTITIPSSVTTIGDDAFLGCTLTSITNYRSTPQSINNGMFQNMTVDSKNCKLYVPSGSVSAYKNATGWWDLSVVALGPTYLDADFAIDFRSNPYTVVGGGSLPTGVTVAGTPHSDISHGYTNAVITIPVKAGNYKVTMGTCKYSNVDGSVKTEDDSYTYATLATKTEYCYHQNTTTNVVSEIITIPTDQIIKVYGAQYTPYFAIQKMPEIPAFTDFEINFRENPYQMVSGAKPAGTVIAGSYNDPMHGYQNVEATVPMEAGTYRLTLGACEYGSGAGTVTSVLNEELVAFNQNLGAGKCYHNNTAANIVSTTFTVDIDQNITIDCGQYTPYMKLEKISAYHVVFALDDAEGVAPAAVDVTIGEALTMPVNKTMYKDGYTLTGWSDGVNDYAIGAGFIPTTDAVLTPVFTANAIAITDATEEVTVRWYFGKSNNAPDFAWQNNSGFLVAQVTVGGNPMDVRFAVNATASGAKFSNAGRTDKWAQVNNGTILSFPGKEGAVVTVESYNNNPEHYAINAAAGTLTCNTNDYYSYLEIVYPAPAPAPAEVNITANVDPEHAGVYYSTFFDSSKKYALPNDGTEAYAAEVSGDAMYLHKIAENNDVLPAGIAVIFKATSGTITLTESDDAPVAISVTNHLHGVDADTEIASVVTGTCYVLSGGSNGVGFYQYSYPNQLKAHKAYIDLNGGAAQAPKRLRFVFNEEQNVTGIDNTKANVKSIKLIENGQLFIIRNGVRYNAAGQIVK